MRGIELREKKTLNTAILGLKSFSPNTEEDIATFSELESLVQRVSLTAPPTEDTPAKEHSPMPSLSSFINQHCEKCLSICRNAVYELSAVFEASVDLKPFS